MVTLPINKLESGMIVAEPIITKRGQTIAKVGTELTNQLIAKLTFYKIESVTVEDPVTEEEPKVAAEDMFLSDEKPIQQPVREKTTSNQITYTQRLKASPKFQQFQSDYALNMTYLVENFEAIIAGGGSECQDMLLESCESLFKAKTSLELFDMLHNMRQVDDSIYAHSLNVALISRAIGKWLRLPKGDLDTLTLCGLLHDIGKTQLPSELFSKPGAYTDEERELVNSHPLLGNKILKGKGFDSRILLATLQHHERCDGSGYPRGLMDDEIDDFASIICIADVYDAMTSARSYRDPLCSFQVIAEFEKEGLKKYNTKYLLTFLEHIASTYNNSRIILNNAKTGRVVYINKNNLSRPVLELDNGDILDLSHPDYKDLFIRAIL